jgi:hypothetical protein
MDSLTASFAANPGLRLLAAVIFFVLLGIWFSWRYAGRGRLVFLGVCLLLGALFTLSPLVQLIAFLPLAALILLSLSRPPASRPTYRPAQALIEGGGLKRGLTAAEAAVILEMPINRVLGVVILGLLRKGAVEIQAGNPLVAGVAPLFQRAGEPGPQEGARLRRETAQAEGIVLHPYEDPFIEQIGTSPDVPLGKMNLAAPARALLRQTARRVRGHNLEETRTYYRKHLGRARHDVALKGDGPDAKKTHDQFFEWLVLDPEFAELYRDFSPNWLKALDTGASESGGPGLVEWVEGLVRELGSSIPPGGLQVRDEAGLALAIGGTDPVTERFFQAVMRELN